MTDVTYKVKYSRLMSTGQRINLTHDNMSALELSQIINDTGSRYAYEVESAVVNKEPYEPSIEDKEKNLKTIEGLMKPLAFREELAGSVHALITASVMLARSSWPEFLFCYEAAKRLLENPNKTMADVCREMGMTEEEMNK